MLDLGVGGKGEVMFLINLENCYVILVKIPKFSHHLENETFVLQSVYMIAFTAWKYFLEKYYGHTCSFYEWDHEHIMSLHR